MFDRRQLLFAGAAAFAGCAHTQTPAPSPAADAEFRREVDRLGQGPRRERASWLRRFDPARLTPEGRVLYQAVLPGAEADAALAAFGWGESGSPYPVTHRNGAYRRAADMREQPGVGVRDVNEDTAQIEAQAARGIVAPDFVIDATIPALEAAAERVRANGGRTYEPLAEAMAAQAEALRRLRARAGAEPGLWRLPDGESYYAQVLQLQLGAPLDAREAHARALARCRELQAEADALLRAQGLSEGAVGERLRALARRESSRYAASDEGKAAAVADMNARLARVRTLLAGAFAGGGADTAADVRLLALAQEANGAAGRRQDTSYLVDLGNIEARAKWTLPSVVHHELIPGHILQARFERAANPPQLQVRYAAGYSEGWAIYAEQLADEAGAFADDALGRIGYLQWMLFRIGRVAADTGIHAMRWSRARAVEEMRALQGDNAGFISIEDDVVRFCAQPGVYAAQGLAALHIAELRERMRRSAGARFDLARFHRAMLRHGPLSPPGLEQAARAEFGA